MALGYYPGVRNGYPQLVCSWEGTGYQTGMLIAHDSPEELRVLLYGLRDEPADIVLRTWQLTPGKYALQLGPDADNDRQIDKAEMAHEIEINEQRANAVAFTLPPRRLMVLELKQIEAFPDSGFELPDLAISPEDMHFDPVKSILTVRVHNVGIKPVGPFEISLRDAAGKTLATAKAEALDWPSDLLPRTLNVKFMVKEPVSDGDVVVIDPDHRINEITRANNTASPSGAMP